MRVPKRGLPREYLAKRDLDKFTALDLLSDLRSDEKGSSHPELRQALAEIAPSAMIFIPSRDGISHHPGEFSTDEQIVKGANVLLGTLAKLVARP